MTKRTRVVMIGVLWPLSLVVVGTWAQAQGTQQAVLYTGNDFGVRVYTPTGTGEPQATLVIRVNGRWQEVELKTK
jgi:hypothetical protein